MHRLTRHVGTASSVVALMALASACGSADPASGPTPSPSHSAPTSLEPTHSSSTTSETPEAANARSAGGAVVSFWAKLDVLASDPSQSLADLATVARDQALTQWQRNLTQMRGADLRQVGDAVVNAPLVTFDQTAGSYQVKACVDVSKVNVVDKEGKSVVTPTRLPKAEYTYGVVKGSDAHFYVASDTLQGSPC